MRTIILAFLCVLCTSSFVQAQEVPEIQKTMITKVTATWCPNCGSWGWDFFEGVIEDNGTDKAIYVGAHHSGTLDSDAGAAFSANFNAPYQPYFYAGNQDLGVSSGNVAAKRTETQELINQNADQSPVANVGFEATLADNSLTVTTKTKFFQDTDGEYYLGLYILENNVIAAQSSNSSTASHKYVLRTSITPDIFGPQIVTGAITAGTEVADQTFTYELSTDWSTENISVMGVLWKKEGNTYQFVNVNTINEFSAPVAVQTISENIANVTLTPTIAQDHTQLSVQIQQNTLEASILLFDLQGRLLLTIFTGILNEGLQHFDINTTDLTNGKYFVRMQSKDGRVLSKPFIVQQ